MKHQQLLQSLEIKSKYRCNSFVIISWMIDITVAKKWFIFNRINSSSGVAGGQIISSSTSNTSNATNRTQRESRLLTTKQPTSGTSLSTGKERLRGTSVSSNESVGEIPTRRSVRQNTASPLATPAGNTRGASRSVDDVNRRKTRSGAGE